jgi:hypothetical protein
VPLENNRMNLTFVTDLGQTFTVEIDPSMELENVMALLEAEVWVPVSVIMRQVYLHLVCSLGYLSTNRASNIGEGS